MRLEHAFDGLQEALEAVGDALSGNQKRRYWRVGVVKVKLGGKCVAYVRKQLKCGVGYQASKQRGAGTVTP